MQAISLIICNNVKYHFIKLADYMDCITLDRQIGNLNLIAKNSPFVICAIYSKGLVLKIKVLGKTKYLFIRVSEPPKGIWLADSCDEMDRKFPLVQTINKNIANSIITSVKYVGKKYERVVEISICSTDGLLGCKKTFYIIVELTGRISAIYFCDCDKKILDRSVKTPNNSIGKNYRLPDANDLVAYDNHDVIQNVLRQPPNEWNIAGLPPLLKKEVIFRNKNGTIDNYFEVLNTIKSETYSNQNAYVFYSEKSLKAITIIRCTHLLDYKCKTCENIDEAFVWAENKCLQPRRLKDEKTRYKNKVLKELTAKERLIEKQKELEQEYINSHEIKKTGDLITANIYRIKPGQKAVTVYDWEKEKDVEIKLNPAKTPSANAQIYYKKYKKAHRGLKMLRLRLKSLEIERQWLNEQLWLIDQAQNESELEGLIVKKQNTKVNYSKNKKNKQIKKKFEPFLVIDCCKYYVGKSAQQNDFITFSVASKTDYWFHASDVPGAHVLLKKTEGRITDENIYHGALLAAWFSKAKQNPKAKVKYTTVSNLKKVSDSRPGLVILKAYKSIIVDPQKIIGFLPT